MESESGGRRTGDRHVVQEKKSPVHEVVPPTKKLPKENSGLHNKCQRLLIMVKQHSLAGAFKNFSAIPEYARAVHDPIDLTVLENRLAAGKYTTYEDFIAAIKSIWSNVLNFTQPGSELHNASLKMSEYFEGLMEKTGQQTSKGSKGNKGKGNRKNIMDRPLSNKEKTLLKHNIMRLSPDKLQGVAKIIKSVVDAANSEALEFDIDMLPTSIARELDMYVKNNIEDDKKKETVQVEVINSLSL